MPTITPAQAEQLLPDEDVVHTYAGMMPMLGADWNKASIIELLGQAKSIEIDWDSLLGRMGHPIAILRPNGRWLNVEAKRP